MGRHSTPKPTLPLRDLILSALIEMGLHELIDWLVEHHPWS